MGNCTIFLDSCPLKEPMKPKTLFIILAMSIISLILALAALAAAFIVKGYPTSAPVWCVVVASLLAYALWYGRALFS